MEFYNGKPRKIFNINLKKKQLITYEDIENMADTMTNNYFYYYNFFSNIQVSQINGLPGSVFNYFTGLNENVQDNFNNTREILTGITYDPTLDITTIDNNLTTNDIICDDIASDNMSSNTINITKINSNQISNIKLKSNEIYCNSLKSKILEFDNDIGVYLYLNNIMFPINKSLTKSQLNYDNITTIKVTIKPHYRIDFYNNNMLLVSITNNTDNIKYYQDVTDASFTKIRLYLRNILLL